jgi:UPF0042 nucleotide-binding protein
MKNSKNIKKPELILVVGQSGAGLATTVKSLEDLGFYCIDNLPFEMVLPTVDLLVKKQVSTLENGIAMGIHIHAYEQAQEFTNIIKTLKNKIKVVLLFIKADTEVLLTRFSTSRRKHPLLDKCGKIADAIHFERKILEEIEIQADAVIDTSTLSPHNLSRLVESRFQDEHLRQLFVSIASFGFKYGIYKPTDTLFDVRFLQNPFFVPSLKDKTGLDPEVKEFLFHDKIVSEYLQKLFDWHTWLLPKYYDEGKHFFRIAIGCTGGRHRSVFIADELNKKLKSAKLHGIVVNVSHRDIEQDEKYKQD